MCKVLDPPCSHHHRCHRWMTSLTTPDVLHCHAQLVRCPADHPKHRDRLQLQPRLPVVVLSHHCFVLLQEATDLSWRFDLQRQHRLHFAHRFGRFDLLCHRFSYFLAFDQSTRKCDFLLDHCRQDLSVLPREETIRPLLQLRRSSEALSVFHCQARLRSCRKRERLRRRLDLTKTGFHPLVFRLLVSNFLYPTLFRQLHCFPCVIKCFSLLLFTPVTPSNPRNLVVSIP